MASNQFHRYKVVFLLLTEIGIDWNLTFRTVFSWHCFSENALRPRTETLKNLSGFCIVNIGTKYLFPSTKPFSTNCSLLKVQLLKTNLIFNRQVYEREFQNDRTWTATASLFDIVNFSNQIHSTFQRSFYRNRSLKMVTSCKADF